MTAQADHILDRRRLRNQITRWRVIAAVAALVAVGVGAARLAGGAASGEEHVARVRVSGFIGMNADREQTLRDLGKSKAKAIILHVDSPGGSASGAEALQIQLRQAAGDRPVVAVIGGLAASGGYIAALASDHILARRNSLVGSIGVIIQYPNAARLLDTLGVKVEEVKSTPLKAAPSGFEPTSPEARAALQSVVTDGYDWFKDLVKTRRKLDETTLATVADGRVFTGGQALTLKLIDGFGGEREALEWLKTTHKLDIDALPVRDWPRKRGFDPARLPGMAAASLAESLGLSSLARAIAGRSGAGDGAAVDGLLALWQPDLR